MLQPPKLRRSKLAVCHCSYDTNPHCVTFLTLTTECGEKCRGACGLGEYVNCPCQYHFEPLAPTYMYMCTCMACCWGSNESLTLRKLSWKLAVIMTFCSASRNSDLKCVSVNQVLPEWYSYLLFVTPTCVRTSGTLFKLEDLKLCKLIAYSSTYMYMYI